jgi:Tfp pilus assembly protein PilO
MMTLIQTPLPPLPPMAPDPMVIMGPGPPEWVGFVAALSLVIGGIILFPLVRALARRLEGKGTDNAMRAELEQLHDRVAELEQMEQRFSELENRLEFSERLLTQQRETLLQRPEGA